MDKLKILLRLRILFVVAAVLTMLPTVCSAASSPPQPGPYASAAIGVTAPPDANPSTTNYSTDSSYTDQVKFTSALYISGNGGYNFGYLRLEGELSYQYASQRRNYYYDNSHHRHENSPELTTLAMMVNGFVDFHNSTWATPYLGGGVGLADMHLSGAATVNNSSQPPYGGGNDIVFAYQLGAGVNLAFNPSWAMDIGYRYFATNRANFNSDADLKSSLKYQSHIVLVGLRYKF
jgi:opacity protein-like surface antigen